MIIKGYRFFILYYKIQSILKKKENVIQDCLGGMSSYIDAVKKYEISKDSVLVK